MKHLLPLVAISLFALNSIAAEQTFVPGENVRVSTSDDAYGEPYVAAHPAFPRRLIGIASRFIDGIPRAAAIFISSDGGSTWRESALPVDKVELVVDCWVTLADSGNAYATALVIEPGDRRTRIAVYRSTDRGETWQHATTTRSDASFDRPSVIARGSEVVIVAEQRKNIVLLYSKDAGATFSQRAFQASRNVDLNAMNPLWTDRGVFVPYVDYGSTLESSRVNAVETNDFGATWSAPAALADIPMRFPAPAHFAKGKSGFHAAFASGTSDARSVSVVSSADGVRWSAPVRVTPSGVQAFRPSIAVNDAGVVAVTWLQTDPPCTRVWFATSGNGGRTFSAPAAVADEQSCADNPLNRAAFERWSHGGDYFGLTADGESFVAFWPDARLGAFQIFSARITPAAQ